MAAAATAVVFEPNWAENVGCALACLSRLCVTSIYHSICHHSSTLRPICVDVRGPDSDKNLQWQSIYSFFFQFAQPSSPMEYIFHFPLKFHRFEVQFRQFHCAVTHSSHRTRIISLLFFLRKIYNLSFIQHIYRERGSAITRVKSSTLANFFRAIDCGTRWKLQTWECVNCPFLHEKPLVPTPKTSRREALMVELVCRLCVFLLSALHNDLIYHRH